MFKKVAHVYDYHYIRGLKNFNIKPSHAQLTYNICKIHWDMQAFIWWFGKWNRKYHDFRIFGDREYIEKINALTPLQYINKINNNSIGRIKY